MSRSRPVRSVLESPHFHFYIDITFIYIMALNVLVDGNLLGPVLLGKFVRIF